MKMYRYLFRQIKLGKYEHTGAPNVLRFTAGKRWRYYAIVEKHDGILRPIAWLYLWQKKDWKAWEVMQVFVFGKARGQGLAKKLYKTAVNTDKLILASGKSQSASSRALWKSFVANDAFVVYAIDYWDLRVKSPVFVQDGELWSKHEIYFTTSDIQDRDIRLIATRKKK